jgi:hypothetical protein
LPRNENPGIGAEEARGGIMASLLAFDAVVLQVAGDDPESYERMRHRHTIMQ